MSESREFGAARKPITRDGDITTPAITLIGVRVGLRWSSKALRWTSYWERRDTCPATPLDHILGTEEAQPVRAHGACETVGCEEQEACPVYVKMVSDHCPVSAAF